MNHPRLRMLPALCCCLFWTCSSPTSHSETGADVRGAELPAEFAGAADADSRVGADATTDLLPDAEIDGSTTGAEVWPDLAEEALVQPVDDTLTDHFTDLTPEAVTDPGDTILDSVKDLPEEVAVPPEEVIVDSGTDLGPDGVVSPLEDVLEDLGSDLPKEEEVTPDIAADIPVIVLPPAPGPKAYSEGSCPTLAAGANTLQSKGFNRELEVYLPAAPTGAPLLFMYHGSNGTPEGMVASFQAQWATEEFGAVVVSLGSCCHNNLPCCGQFGDWNFSFMTDIEADLVFFDDVLSCVDGQWDINNNRVYAVGVSAGGLWTTHLTSNRGQYLASTAIFSGGTGLANNYSTPGYDLPVVLTWGGESDVLPGPMFPIDFHEMSLDFSGKLQSDGHLVIECNHGQGHKVLPGSPQWSIEFLMHQQWGQTDFPLSTAELESLLPDYCVLQ